MSDDGWEAGDDGWGAEEDTTNAAAAEEDAGQGGDDDSSKNKGSGDNKCRNCRQVSRGCCISC